MPEFVFDPSAVRRAMQSRRITRAELARQAGLTHASAVSKILSGDRTVKVEEAARIYGFLNLVPVEHEATRAVPLIGMAAAGRWREAIELPHGRMVIPAQIGSSRAFAVEVKGDSIDLVVEDGGWIVVDPEDRVLSPGRFYLLMNGEHGVTVKRYQKLPPRFEPASTNSEHRDLLVADHDFIIVGRIVWKGGLV